jgi:hypothetical protein
VLWLSLAYFVALLPFLPTLGHLGEHRQPPVERLAAPRRGPGPDLVMTIGGIDLSQGAVIGLTSTLGAALAATAADPEILSKRPIWGRPHLGGGRHPRRRGVAASSSCSSSARWWA